MKIIRYLPLTFFVLQSFLFSQQIVLDNFNSSSGWEIINSPGVIAELKIANGFSGKALELDYNFLNGTGYCGVQKKIKLDLSKNFEFSFYLKGDGPPNNLEFKLLDSTGENVWWKIKRNFHFPSGWKKITIKKRDIVFAWGPTQNKNLNKINRVEFTVSSSNGGKGKIYIDSLIFSILPEPPENPPPLKVWASKPDKMNPPEFTIDSNPKTKWRVEGSGSIIYDFGYQKETGGVIIHWDSLHIAKNFGIFVSNNGADWEKINELKNNRRKINFIQTGNPVSRYLKISINSDSQKKISSITEVEFKDYRFSEYNNYYFKTVAEYYPKGIFPRYYYGEQAYWTVTGTDKDPKEALLNEDGMIETDKQNFSVIPYVKFNGKLFTWNDVEKSVQLTEKKLPLPSVVWKNKNFELKISTFASGEDTNSLLVINYSFVNLGSADGQVSLFLAFSPFQVVPPWQSLNFQGGFTPIKEIAIDKNYTQINGRKIYFFPKPRNIETVDLTKTCLLEYFKHPATTSVKNNELLHGKFFTVAEYRFNIKPGEKQDFGVVIPFHSKFNGSGTIGNNGSIPQLKKQTGDFWKQKLNRVIIKGSPAAEKYINTLKTNLSYILINKDENKIQPGSRTYERSWIRDGALTSTALLEFGLREEVKSFIEWYRKYLSPDGKVPCVVDSRGPDPVDENDSNGEFIYLISQYFNFTKDTTFLGENFPYVKNAVEYIKSMIAKRSTPYFKNGNDSLKAFYGLVPESISHEGYSAKPMHSYWDDFFTLLGIKRAKQIAEALNKKMEFAEYSKLEKTFRHNLISSIRLATKLHKINFIPGSVELGDFDPTSTAISVFPCFEHENLPDTLLQTTFNRYYEFFAKRIESGDWVNFTPYELRIAGAYNILGEKEKALRLLDFFMNYRRPQNWNEWAEIVWKDKRRPDFIGDMPHTWVGSGFINFFRSLLVYENENNNALILCSGIPESWIDKQNGFTVKNLPTYYGNINFSVKKKNEKVYSVRIEGLNKLPPGGIIIKNINLRPIKKVFKNGMPFKNFTGSEIKIDNHLPVELDVYY